MVTQNRLWNDSTRAAPQLLGQMAKDIGLGDDCIARALMARQATFRYCLRQIQATDGEIEMGELSRMAEAYHDGYYNALNEGDELVPYPQESALGSVRKAIAALDAKDPW